MLFTGTRKDGMTRFTSLEPASSLTWSLIHSTNKYLTASYMGGPVPVREQVGPSVWGGGGELRIGRERHREKGF